MSSDGKQVWKDFPQDLFSVPALSKEYVYLNDEKVLRELGQEIRAKFFLEAEKSGKFEMKGGAVLLKGGTSLGAKYYDTDTVTTPFRQESFFQYLFRLCEPDCYGVMLLESKKSLLFVPALGEETFRWNGPAKSTEFYKQRFGFDIVEHVPKLIETLATNGVTTVYTLKGINTDSGMTTVLKPDLKELMESQKYEGKSEMIQDEKALYSVLAECRVIKTKREIDYLRRGCLVSSQAHVVNGSILHYGHAGRPNDRVLKKDDMVVLDMGGEFQGYATDITASYPVSGKFTKDQEAIHTAVREAQEAVFSQLKPGTSWLEMHKAAERVILTHLLNIGILKDATVEELMAEHIGAVFMPHGLGHFMGLDVHDVNGYPEGGDKKDSALGVKWLRTQRVLKAGMVITVEPGCYFIKLWIEAALKDEKKARFFDKEVLGRYIEFVGVIFEDDIVITEKGMKTSPSSQRLHPTTSRLSPNTPHRVSNARNIHLRAFFQVLSGPNGYNGNPNGMHAAYMRPISEGHSMHECDLTAMHIGSDRCITFTRCDDKLF
ncbi:hypothetical protein AAMO2058_001412500 [Amorphochlora amoebiformis]